MFLLDEEGQCPHHIVVMCRGRFFSFAILDESRQLITVPEIERQLQHIRSKCDREAERPSIGPLTVDNRTTWAKVCILYYTIRCNHIYLLSNCFKFAE